MAAQGRAVRRAGVGVAVTSALRSVVLATALATTSAQAHPTAFAGAWIVQTFAQPDMVLGEIAYSVSSRWAIGVDAMRETMTDPLALNYTVARVNHLVHRWNLHGAQANIYLSAGAGAVWRDAEAARPGVTRAAGFGALDLDYETQRVYTSLKLSQVAPLGSGAGLRALPMAQARLGLAAHTVEYGGFNPWVILQAQYLPTSRVEKWRVGPVIRFYVRNILWESGVTTRGTWIWNFMVHL